MKMTLDQIDLNLLYERARTGFRKCIASSDNEFLKAEIPVSVDKIITENNWIRLQFFGTDKDHYIVEVRLDLFGYNKDELGYYCYHVDENGNVVDDYLVFE